MEKNKIEDLQQIFDEANRYFYKKDYSNYINKIILLHSYLQCNCFFRLQDSELFPEQLEIINSTNFDTPDWSENFAKGFIYLKNKDEMLANHYFTIALDIKEHPLLYSLRSFISPRENPNNFDDSLKAIKLKPSARNYFLHASLFDDLKTREGAINNLKFLSKAIALEPNFACAYNNRANQNLTNKDIREAISDYKCCVQNQPDHWSYKSLIKCLLQEKKIGEALYYINLALINSVDMEFYILKKAEILINIEEYGEAIGQLEIFLKKFPDNYKVQYEIEKIQESRIKNYLIKAENFFENKDFLKAATYYQLFKDNGKPLIPPYLENSLISIVKINNPNFDLIKEKEQFESEISPSDLKEYQDWEKINFGKYKGIKIDKIILSKLDYILWCVINLNHFTIPNIWFIHSNFRNNKLFYPALERNIVKQELVPQAPKYNTYDRDDYEEPNPMNSEYYNDSLDMDQQSPEFWDSI